MIPDNLTCLPSPEVCLKTSLDLQLVLTVQ